LRRRVAAGRRPLTEPPSRIRLRRTRDAQRHNPAVDCEQRRCECLTSRHRESVGVHFRRPAQWKRIETSALPLGHHYRCAEAACCRSVRRTAGLLNRLRQHSRVWRLRPCVNVASAGQPRWCRHCRARLSVRTRFVTPLPSTYCARCRHQHNPCLARTCIVGHDRTSMPKSTSK